MNSHRDLMETCLKGEKPDRVPVALWRHFPVDDQYPERLASAILNFQKEYDFDLVKVTPSSSFCLKDWGSLDQWRGSTEGTRDYVHKVIEYPEDWEKLPLLDPGKGYLNAQICCLELLQNEIDSDTPIIQTIFNPLSQAKNLVGQDKLLVHLRKHPEAVHAGLKRITESTQRFVESALKTGISGIFYAVQHAQYHLLSVDEYKEFGTTYDRGILEMTKGSWLNMLHLHGSDVMFDLFLDYPVQIVNWHDRETWPSLSQAMPRFNGVLCGGLRRKETLVLGTPDQVKNEAVEAIQITDGRRFILGTGCVVPIIAPYGNILAARKSVEDVS